MTKEQENTEIKIEELLIQGIESLRNGDGIEATPELWNGIRKRFQEKHGRELGAPKKDSDEG
jgi:hypothetical protein